MEYIKAYLKLFGLTTGLILLISMWLIKPADQVEIPKNLVTSGFSEKVCKDEKCRNQVKPAIFPYQEVNYRSLGGTFVPNITACIQLDNDEICDNYLLDSGAAISSIPRSVADKLGLQLAQLPRFALAGYGANEVFVYKTKINMRIGNQQMILPVVFPESRADSSYILGRQGFFDRCMVIFDDASRQIIIRNCLING